MRLSEGTRVVDDETLKTELKRTGASADGLKFAIVVSRWHADFTSRLEAGARQALLALGAAEDDVHTFDVPGAFELPLACLKAANCGKYSAIIALGVIIRGDTPHFEYVAGETARGVMQVSLKTRIPVMFGVITADNIDQVEARCDDGPENKGFEAAVSAVEMVASLKRIDDANPWQF